MYRSDPTTFDLGELLHEVVATAARDRRFPAGQPAIQFNTALTIHVVADRAALRELLLTLLTSTPSPITVQSEPEPAAVADRRLWLRITGQLPADNRAAAGVLAKMLEPLTAALGAQLEQAPAGSLTVQVPLALVDASAADYTPAPADVIQVEPSAWRQRGPRAPRRILVADDTTTILLIVEKILTTAGYEVDTVKNGQEALSRLLTDHYCLAILDLHMPDLDGITLLKQYRLHKPRAAVPVIFLTANSTMDATRECAEVGADAFLTKPVRRERLLTTVESILKERAVRYLNPPAVEEPVPLLNAEALRELRAIYHSPGASGEVIDAFRGEALELMGRIEAAAQARQYPVFRDLVHSLRTSATSVGATALAAACVEMETLSLAEFLRVASEEVVSMRRLYQASLAALQQELEQTGHET
jgi:CheY-like chemotaxis protein